MKFRLGDLVMVRPDEYSRARLLFLVVTPELCIGGERGVWVLDARYPHGTKSWFGVDELYRVVPTFVGRVFYGA